ncbi:response regulator [Pseudoalteromonas tunicata]|uniref:response regulator n=1 Tax=Pseudoalteromonas tunicata TaxID=314281 RepID=UPI00273EC27F|nr:response regulator [Pseudoalteromonas tunicata]MDP5213512.1 response regulator [Pseudoalteromonas tunicata]
MGRKIYIVSDKVKSAEILLRQFQLWQAEVHLFDNHEDLKENLNGTLADLILIDEELADKTLCSWLQSNLISEKTKLIIMERAIAKNSSTINDTHCGYISKPILPEQLLYTYNKLTETRVHPNNVELRDDFPLLSRQYSILIVDDNEINRVVSSALLEQMPLELVVAENGQIALDLLQGTEHRKFDLILMDCQMPILDGFEATKLIRRGFVGKHYQDVIIIAMTAGAMSGDKDACIQAGMDDFIAKPIDPGAFINKVLAWLEKSKAND